MEDDKIPLREGEQLLWQGRPPGGIIFRTYDLFFVPFSIVWTGFAIFWTLIVYLELALSVISDGKIEPATIPSLIIGPFFVVVGLSFTVGRFLIDGMRRARTRYAITNKRAIIRRGKHGEEIDSLPITRSLKVKMRGRSVGDILLGEDSPLTFFMSPMQFSGPPHPFMFERVKDVRAVYDLILEIQDRSPV